MFLLNFDIVGVLFLVHYFKK